MRCCTDVLHRLSGRALLPAVLLALLGGTSTEWAQDETAPILDAVPENRVPSGADSLDPVLQEVAEIIDRAREGEDVAREEWVKVCESLNLHASIKGFVLDVDPFPAVPLVDLLTAPQLQTRLGALEILEGKAGTDLGFDAWDPASGASQASLEQWKTWAPQVKPRKEAGLTGNLASKILGLGEGDADSGQKPAAIDEIKLRGYIADILGEDPDRRERALTMICGHGLQPAASLERYLNEHPELPASVRARVREAQFRVVLTDGGLGNSAARVARDLAFGTRDARLDAMLKLPVCGRKALPILALSLDDPDALIRESSIDLLLQIGGETACDLAEKRLNVETDDNVVHAALRRFKDCGKSGALLLGRYVRDDNEDLAVAALHGLGEMKSSEAVEALPDLLKDPRWRLRSAAIEYAGKREESKARDAVLAALTDEDEFVRYSAIKACGELQISGAAKKLSALAEKDEAVLAPVVEALIHISAQNSRGISSSAPLPSDFAAKLPKKSGEALLPVIQILKNQLGRSDGARGQIENLMDRFGDHADPDVRHAALVAQAQAGLLFDRRVRDRMLTTLKAANPDQREEILSVLRLSGLDLRETAGEGAENEELEASLDVFERVAASPGTRSAAANRVISLLATGRPPEEEPPVVENSSQAGSESEAWRIALETWMREDPSPVVAFQVALKLMNGGHRPAFEWVLGRLPKQKVQQRLAAVSHLPLKGRESSRLGPRIKEMVTQFLRDDSPEVREHILNDLFQSQNPEAVSWIIEETAKAGAKINGHEIYDAGLGDQLDSPLASMTLGSWIEEILKQPTAERGMRVLALVCSPAIQKSGMAERVEAFLADGDPWVRRAAWRSLRYMNGARFNERVDQAASDPSRFVREAVTHAYPNDYGHDWKVLFSEKASSYESLPYEIRDRLRTSRLTENATAALQKLMSDESAEIRVAAMFCLLGHGENVPLWPLKTALEALPDEKQRGYKVADFLNDHSAKLGKGFGFLLDYTDADRFDADELKAMRQRFGLETKEESLITDFATLVKLELPEKGEVRAAEPTKQRVRQTKTELVYFYKPGCKECERTGELLRTLQRSIPGLTVDEINIESAVGSQSNEVLCDRFNVPPNKRQVAPVVFCQAGFLIQDEIRTATVQDLVSRSRRMERDPEWMAVSSSDKAMASKRIEERFESFGIWWIAAAGLLDGVNPCAFATIIFLLSYLQIARRSPREILAVGLAFILAVFLAYFAAGWGLSHVLASLRGFEFARRALNLLLAAFALLIAWLSFRDGLRARRGELKDMTLQLPDFLKDRIRRVVRGSSKSSRYVLAAFGAGIVISFLELACTGQVYLPTILYMLKQGRATAFSYLLIYNLAFILPLVVIFALAFFGMRSEALIRFQAKHTATVRFATAALFAALFVVLLLN